MGTAKPFILVFGLIIIPLEHVTTEVTGAGGIVNILVLDGDQSSLVKLMVDGQYVKDKLLTRTAGKPVDMTYSHVEKRIYWTEPLTSSIRRADINGEHVTTVAILTGSAPSCLVCDDESRKLFYTDYFKHKIESMDLTGSNQQTILNPTTVRSPTKIIIHKRNRHLIWSDHKNGLQISSCNFDGSDIRKIVRKRTHLEISGLPVDEEEDILYWIEYESSLILSVDLHGRSGKVIHRTTDSVLGLFLLDRTLYFTARNQRVHRLSLDGGTAVEIPSANKFVHPFALYVLSGPNYQSLCASIVNSENKRSIPDVDHVLKSLKSELIAEGSLDAYPFKRAREFCSHKNNSRHRSCVFLRRYDLFQVLKRDSNRNKFPYRAALLLHTEIVKFCKEPNFLNSFYDKFPDIDKFYETGYLTEFRETFESLADTYTIEIRKEASKICREDGNSACLLQDVFDLVDKSLVFISHLNKAGNLRNADIYSYFNALTVSSVVTKMKYPSVWNTNDYQNEPVMVLKSISTYLTDGQDTKIRTVLSLLPEEITDSPCDSVVMCHFWRVVDQVRVFVYTRLSSTANRVQVKVIDRNLDKREFLQQKQMERIIKLMGNSENSLITVAWDLKNEFKESLNERFLELKTYFRKVNSFNAQKAKADLVVIEQIKNLTKAASETGRSVDSDMVKISIAMFMAAGQDVGGQIIKLSLTIAENLNPLKALFGLSPSSIYEETSKLAHKVAQMANAGRLLVSIEQLGDKIIPITEGFAKNAAFFDIMERLMNETLKNNNKTTDSFEKAKNAFLKSYNDFIPALKRYQLTEMGSFLKNVIDETCNLIDSTDSLGASIPKGIIGGTGLCTSTKVDIDKLMTMYESIYDKQFELVQVLASNVQAKVALEAADGIVAGYNEVAKAQSESDDVLRKLQLVAGMSSISYKLMIIKVKELYCNELEYKNGGNRPPNCETLGTEIPSFLSYKVSQVSTTKMNFETVPSKRQSWNDTAFMDLFKLYKGEDIYFKIPNSKWINDAGWMIAADKDTVVYVMGMEIYLPSEVVYKPRHITVQVYVEGQNELKPGGTQYRIEPPKPMIFEYKLGDGIRCRKAHTFDNPYNTCPKNKIPDICPLTEYPCSVEVGERGLYPSIYAKFKIRVTSNEGLDIPHAATPLDLRIGLRFFTYHLEGYERRQKSNDQSMRTVLTKCCPPWQYWSTINQDCFDCPVNSTVALRGYYCKKNE